MCVLERGGCDVLKLFITCFVKLREDRMYNNMRVFA